MNNLKQMLQEVDEIFENDPEWVDQPGTPKGYEQYVAEFKQELGEIEGDLDYWRGKLSMYRGDTELMKGAREIIKNLTKNRRETLWSIEHWSSIGVKRKKSLEKEKKEEGQISLQA